MSIIMISSELPEVLGMSDRVYVVSAGRIRGPGADRAGNAGKHHDFWLRLTEEAPSVFGHD